jgi:hypothetical protein
MPGDTLMTSTPPERLDSPITKDLMGFKDRLHQAGDKSPQNLQARSELNLIGQCMQGVETKTASLDDRVVELEKYKEQATKITLNLNNLIARQAFIAFESYYLDGLQPQKPSPWAHKCISDLHKEYIKGRRCRLTPANKLVYESALDSLKRPVDMSYVNYSTMLAEAVADIKADGGHVAHISWNITVSEAEAAINENYELIGTEDEDEKRMKDFKRVLLTNCIACDKVKQGAGDLLLEDKPTRQKRKNKEAATTQAAAGGRT